MDDREKAILQGAQNAWPQALVIAQYRLRQIAERLAERDLLEKRKSTGGQMGYQITTKGRDQLSERNRSIDDRKGKEAENMLCQRLGMKLPKPSDIADAGTSAKIIPLARKPFRGAQ